MRNPALADSVFVQPKIYVIRDLWMDHFPDTLTEFGYTLIRSGKPFSLADCQLSEYKTLYNDHVFTCTDLDHDPALEKTEAGQGILSVSHTDTSHIYKHIIYGPFFKIPKGSYRLIFDLKIDKKYEDSSIQFAKADLSCDFGKKVIVTRTLTPADFPIPGQYEMISLDFSLDNPISNSEIRLYYFGVVDFSFKQARLLRLN